MISMKKKNNIDNKQSDDLGLVIQTRHLAQCFFSAVGVTGKDALLQGDKGEKKRRFGEKNASYWAAVEITDRHPRRTGDWF